MNGQRVGYVRVSSVGQNADRQLEQAAVDRVFADKASGKDTHRPELEWLIAFVREGDTFVVHSMDRLACNLDDLRRLVYALTERGVGVELVKENLTLTAEASPMANLMLSVMGAFAEFERALIREHQLEGIALAKRRGKYRGRKKACRPKRSPSCEAARPTVNRKPSCSGLRHQPRDVVSIGAVSIFESDDLTMPRRRLLTATERASLLAFPETDDALVR